MNFSYITTQAEFEEVEKEIGINCIPKGDVDRVMIVAKMDEKIVGEVAVSIYSSKTLNRKSVWIFGSNKNRSAWIDRIDSNVKGLGRVLLLLAKKWVKERIHLCKRKNLYVASVETNFYRKCGYTRIYTPNSRLDEDYSDSYEQNVANIMALPLRKKFHNETTYYSQFEDKFDKLILVLEGEPDTEGLLPNAKEIVQKRFDEQGPDEWDWMILSICFNTGNDVVTSKMIEILATFPWVDTKAVIYAREGKARYRQYRKDFEAGLESHGVPEEYR